MELGGELFIGGTADALFRAFDARSGEMLWSEQLAYAAQTVPVKYDGVLTDLADPIQSDAKINFVARTDPAALEQWRKAAAKSAPGGDVNARANASKLIVLMTDGLIDTGEPDDYFEADLAGAEYPGGWFVVLASDFSLMDAIECGIVKLPRVPIADNIPGGEMPKFRNLWDHIGKRMPKKGVRTAGKLDPLLGLSA